MSGKRIALFGLCIFAAAMAAVMMIAAWGYQTIRVEEGLIKSKVEERLPIMKEVKIILVKAYVEIDRLDVNLDNNRMNISFTGKAESLGKTVRISASAQGSPDYRNGSFYFRPTNTVFEELDISDLKIRGVKKEMLLNAIESAVELYLANLPVYRVKNDLKGYAVRVMLDKIEVKDRAVLVHLTFWQLTKTILAALFAIISTLAVAALFIFNPKAEI